MVLSPAVILTATHETLHCPERGSWIVEHQNGHQLRKKRQCEENIVHLPTGCDFCQSRAPFRDYIYSKVRTQLLWPRVGVDVKLGVRSFFLWPTYLRVWKPCMTSVDSACAYTLLSICSRTFVSWLPPDLKRSYYADFPIFKYVHVKHIFLFPPFCTL